jgi:hypothetical protein
MNKQLKQFQKELIRISKELKILPQDVSSKEFKGMTELAEWEVRKLGGFSNAHSLLYPALKESSEHIQGMAYVKGFIKSRAKKDSVDSYLKNEFLDVFKDVLPQAGLKVHAPVKAVKKKSVKKRTIVAHVSDTHFGANIQKTEMSDINSFNWEIAARRMGLFADQIVNYKPQYRKDTELVIAINGDIIAGVIHDQEWFADLLSRQAAGTIKILMQFVSYCAQHFETVRVIMTTGNHGRSMHKGNKSRATTHKWDSYETIIYLGVREGLKQHKNVTCEIPETPYAVLDIQGHKFLQTHGDTVINVGNPGTSINMRSINTQINRLNSSALATESFAGIMVGHVHVSTVQITDNGTVLLINGTLSGADPYVQSIGIMGNEPTQMLFEVTPEHAVGDIRFIRLKSADNRKELEKIIEPLKGNLD